MSVKSWFSILDDALTASDRFLNSEALFRAYGFANSLFEGLLDRTPPGATSQRVKGHDHDANGGKGVARNTVYCAGNGSRGLFIFAASNTSFQFADNFAGANSRAGIGFPMFSVPVSPGFTSPGAGVPTGPPYLDAMVAYNFSFGEIIDVEVRFVNQTLGGRTSEEVAIVGTQLDDPNERSWVYIPKIPVVPGWNSLDLQWRSNNVGDRIHTTCIIISESQEVSGSPVCVDVGPETRKLT